MPDPTASGESELNPADNGRVARPSGRFISNCSYYSQTYPLH